MKKPLLPVLASVLLLSASCQQKMYFPDRANTPGLMEAYEVKLTTAWKPQESSSDSGYRSGHNGSSFGADLAFSPVNHLGLIASYRSIHNKSITEDRGTDYTKYGGEFNGHRWEGGIGYFTTFGRLGKFETYAGYGRGEIRRRGITNPERDYNTDYNRIFIQPALGFSNNVVSITGGIRFAYQKYVNFRSDNPNLRYTILDKYTREDVEGATVGFLEPFINAEVGWKYIKFNAQTGCSGQIFGSSVSGNLPFYFSLGLAFHFAPRYLKDTPREPSRGHRHRDEE